MIKDLISAATTTLIACAALQPGKRASGLRRNSRDGHRPPLQQRICEAAPRLANLLGVFVAARAPHIDPQLVARCLQSLEQRLGSPFHHRVAQRWIAREELSQIRDPKNARRHAIDRGRGELPLVRFRQPRPPERFAGPHLLDLSRRWRGSSYSRPTRPFSIR